MKIELRSTSDGVILPVHAQPGARRNGVVGAHAGRLKVAVARAPEKGKANQALVEVLAETFGLRPAQITLRSGATGSRKTFLIQGLHATEITRRIENLLDDRSV